MKPIDLVSLLKYHTHGWVAISKDYTKVLYAGKSFLDVMAKVEKNDQKENVILMQTSKNFRGFVGNQ